MASSFKAIAVGGVVLIASFGLFLVLPRFSPFVLINCIPATPAQSPLEETCVSSVNPVYPIISLFSVGGTIAVFLGTFGKRFVTSPVFVAGMVALEYGLSGVVSGLLDTETGVSVNPANFIPLVAIGAIAICFHTYRRLRRPMN